MPSAIDQGDSYERHKAALARMEEEMPVDPDFNGEADERGRTQHTHMHTSSSDPETFETAPTARAPESGEQSEAPTEERTEQGGLFGSLSPQEAGRRSWEARRERAVSREAEQAHSRADEVLIVRTTVETGRIIEKLAKDAKGGNVQAARELRAWLSELPIETDTDLSALDRRTRQAVLARVLSEIEQAGDEHEPVDVVEAVLAVAETLAARGDDAE